MLQAYLHRTEADCRALAYEGSRVRLCKGAYNEPDEVAYQSRLDVDRSYIRCLKILLAGQGYPMIASHDPRIVEIASSLASRYGRAQGSYEFQMLYGIRPEEQRRLAKSGETDAGLRALRPGVVRVPDETSRGATAEPVILPEVPDLQEIKPRKGKVRCPRPPSSAPA